MLRAEESLKSVFAASGYDQTGYELGTALLEALTNPKCWKRWKKKKKGFSYSRNCFPSMAGAKLSKMQYRRFLPHLVAAASGPAHLVSMTGGG